MIQVQKSHWPPSPEFVPDGWLTTFEAFDLVGRDRFPDKWMDGQELAAPSGEEIAANREAPAKREAQAAERVRRLEKAKKASVSVRSGAPLRRVPRARPNPPTFRRHRPPLDVIADESVRKGARARGDKVWEEIRQWLYAGTVPAAYLDDQGDLREVVRNTWARPAAMVILLTGQAMSHGTVGPVLISKVHLESAIRGEDEPELTQDPGEYEPSPGDPEPHAEKSTETEAQEATPAKEDKPRPKRGARPKYDWDGFIAQVVAIAEYDGLPDTQAEMERKMLEWCENTWGHQPGISTVRTKLRPIYCKLKDELYISEPYDE